MAAIIPILFLGPSWDDLLFPYQLTWFGSVACGLAALMCLERQSRSWDIAATALLVAGLLFSDAGIPFVAGAAVEVALSPRRAQRGFVPVIPTVLWGLWYLGWGHTAHTFVSFDNVAHLPSYVLDGLSSSLSVYLGLSGPIGATDSPALAWGRPLLVLAVGLAIWRILRIWRPPDRLWTVLAILLGYWSLTALNASPFGLPTVGRYQYLGCLGLALLAAELGRGARIGRWATIGILAVAASAGLSNYTGLRDAANGLAVIAQKTRGGLGALELARDRVDPDLQLTLQNSNVDYLGLVDARSYLSAVDAYGSPAYSPSELADAPEVSRVAADRVSGAALGIHLAAAGAGTAGRCLEVTASEAADRGGPGRRIGDSHARRRRCRGPAPLREGVVPALVRQPPGRARGTPPDPTRPFIHALDASAERAGRRHRLPDLGPLRLPRCSISIPSSPPRRGPRCLIPTARSTRSAPIAPSRGSPPAGLSGCSRPDGCSARTG